MLMLNLLPFLGETQTNKQTNRQTDNQDKRVQSLGTGDYKNVAVMPIFLNITYWTGLHECHYKEKTHTMSHVKYKKAYMLLTGLGSMSAIMKSRHTPSPMLKIRRPICYLQGSAPSVK